MLGLIHMLYIAIVGTKETIQRVQWDNEARKEDVPWMDSRGKYRYQGRQVVNVIDPETQHYVAIDAKTMKTVFDYTAIRDKKKAELDAKKAAEEAAIKASRPKNFSCCSDEELWTMLINGTDKVFYSTNYNSEELAKEAEAANSLIAAINKKMGERNSDLEVKWYGFRYYENKINEDGTEYRPYRCDRIQTYAAWHNKKTGEVYGLYITKDGYCIKQTFQFPYFFVDALQGAEFISPKEFVELGGLITDIWVANDGKWRFNKVESDIKGTSPESINKLAAEGILTSDSSGRVIVDYQKWDELHPDIEKKRKWLEKKMKLTKPMIERIMSRVSKELPEFQVIKNNFKMPKPVELNISLDQALNTVKAESEQQPATQNRTEYSRRRKDEKRKDASV